MINFTIILYSFTLINAGVYSPILNVYGGYIPCKDGGIVAISPFPDLRILCLDPTQYDLDEGTKIEELTEKQKNTVENLSE